MQRYREEMSDRLLKMVWEGKRTASRTTENWITILAALGMLLKSLQSNSGRMDIQSMPKLV